MVSTVATHSRSASFTASFRVRLPEVTGRDLGTEQLHPEHVELLALGVDLAHEHGALEPEQRRCRGRRHAVLPGSRLGDHARLAHAGREQRLPDHVVELVRAGVGQVLALEQHPHARAARRAAGTRSRASGGRRSRAAASSSSCAKRRVGPGVVERLLELEAGGHQRLGDVAAAELAEPAVRVPALSIRRRRRSPVPPVVGLAGWLRARPVPCVGVSPRPLSRAAMKSRSFRGSFRPATTPRRCRHVHAGRAQVRHRLGHVVGPQAPRTRSAGGVDHALGQPPVEHPPRPRGCPVHQHVVRAELVEAADARARRPGTP